MLEQAARAHRRAHQVVRLATLPISLFTRPAAFQEHTDQQGQSSQQREKQHARTCSGQHAPWERSDGVDILRCFAIQYVDLVGVEGVPHMIHVIHPFVGGRAQIGGERSGLQVTGVGIEVFRRQYFRRPRVAAVPGTIRMGKLIIPMFPES